MDMAWFRLNILLSVWLFVSPVFTFTEQSGFRRYYVLQPGPSGTDRVHVSSISSRAGSPGQPHTYNVELTASIGGQVRTRRMGSETKPSLPLRQDTAFTQQQHLQQHIRQSSHTSVHHSHQVKISGINICGGQCCHGWSRAPGSQRCTKPNCQPQCQNGGMCLRPQLCVCKPGSKGKACEQKTAVPSNPPVAGNGHTPSHTPGYTDGHSASPQRPIPQQAQSAVPGPHTNTAQMTLTVKQPPRLLRAQATQQVRSAFATTLHQTQSQQFFIKPKYNHPPAQPADRSIPLSGGGHNHSPSHGGNHTGRIRVVFTPSICKLSCIAGKCQNSCEMGNTTTIISENGHATDTLTASNFRVVVCHLPCMNGGKCNSRERCQCPLNFTGKFCQVALRPGAQPQVPVGHAQSTQVHTTHTLPLTIGGGPNQGKFSSSVVNIHVKHPPEASVQVHQVSQLDSRGQQAKISQSGHYVYHTDTSHKGQQGHHVYPNQKTFIHHYPVTSKSTLGRCFQETAGTQCGKPLPGLSKQEDCCNSIGTSWGFHKCQKCPKQPSIPLTDSRHAMDCPQGYKRINNNSYCQDVNECLLQGVCPNGDCVNTVGSYRCICKAGFIPDSTFTTCIPDTPAILEEKGACFRFVGSGKQCLHPVSVQLSKQLCCCSVGKAWGPLCDKCPIPGTAAFKEICPGGMGYTVSGTYRPKPINRNQPDAIGKPNIVHQEPQAPPVPLPTVQRPVEALGITERQLPVVPVVTTAPEEELMIPGANNRSVVEHGQPQLSPGVSTIRMEPIFPEVVEKTSPPSPVAILPSSASQGIAPTQTAEVNECLVSPHICGAGICYNTAMGYTCICHDGHQLNEDNTTCTDVDECQDPEICGQDSLCVNTRGSFICQRCQEGYRMSLTGHCEDVNECLDPSVCPAGMCTNTRGSYLCDPCPEGFEGRHGQCVDIDECQDPSMCANGNCTNLEGYFVCMCHSGYKLRADGRACTDFDECQDAQLCSRGHCHNTKGSFICSCEPGFKVSPAGNECDDVDECTELPEACGRTGECSNSVGSYLCTCSNGFQLKNRTHCEDVDECTEDPDVCGPHGWCLNVPGSFSCVCSEGFASHMHYHICEDVNECTDETRCPGKYCLNTDGSYICDCQTGYRLHIENDTCIDVDECEVFGHSICGAWRCENTLGSYRCRAECPEGHQLGVQGACEDFNECVLNDTLCAHGHCVNMVGSYSCICDPGFASTQEGRGCVDVNECEMLTDPCGEAFCENVEGSFLCVCPDRDQEYDQMTAKCVPTHTEPSGERKECYYSLNNEKLCDSVLASSVTLEECCCTLGAGWGDNCEVHPCPVEGTDQFNQMCAAGKGSIPTTNSVLEGTSPKYDDANECALFGQEICKGGFCLNTESGYECYCRQGLYYDDVKLQCVDVDECQDAGFCTGGTCVNTMGSYHCFCPPPLELDHAGQHCVSPVSLEPDVYQSVCWRRVSPTQTCEQPMVTPRTTYTECCCLYGEAWGMDCAFCPKVDTEDYVTMCNKMHSEGQRPYGRDALTAPETDYYEPTIEFHQRPNSPSFVPLHREEEGDQQGAFEGLRAEECGILDGCENGRCVRVQEGYTCDCFDGYTLDMSRMACVDVNECSELNSHMALCKNGECINTVGSYKCVCLPGFEASARPNYCVPSRKGADGTE